MAESLPCFESKAHFPYKASTAFKDNNMTGHTFTFTTGNVFNTKQERCRRAAPAKAWKFLHKGFF